MKKKSIKPAIKGWAETISPRKAHLRLVKRNLSASLIEKLFAGTYKHEPSGVVRSILVEELAKDGIKAS